MGSKIRFRVVILVSLAGALLWACAASPDRKVVLDDTLRAYHKTLRWGDIPSATQFQREPDEIMDRTAFRGLRVTGYQVLNRRMEDEDTLTQTVEVSYFREDEAVERSVTDSQRWIYDEERGRWLLESPLVEFK